MLHKKGDINMAMDSAQIRHHNFQKLYADFVNQRPHLPQRGMLKLFAEHLNLSDRYLSHIKCNRKNIGSNVARAIEERLHLPHGWMDREHDQSHDRLSTPVNENEKLFVEMALTLFRSQQADAQELLMTLLRQRLEASLSKPLIAVAPAKRTPKKLLQKQIAESSATALTTETSTGMSQ
jgi:hypothetical protein